ncbi:MAG: lactate dehydrogenase [Pedobacter sp.]|nr:MAG: lactate dehydrogenase [Pedobacter sp.]
MRVVAYSIKSADKEPLALANHKRHEITLISNSLTAETVFYAKGKDAVIVYTGDDVSAPVINQLADLGIKYIATRSTDTSHIDHIAAGVRQLKIANVPQSALTDLDEEGLSMALAVETIHNLDKWQEKKCLGDACVCSKACDQVKVNPSNPRHGH